MEVWIEMDCNTGLERGNNMKDYLHIIPPLRAGEYACLTAALRHHRAVVEAEAEGYQGNMRDRSYKSMEAKVGQPSYLWPRPDMVSVRFTAGELERLIKAGQVGAWGGQVVLKRLIAARGELREAKRKRGGT
tara:strand:+ start:3127 stop:3522 length:396 start_codon:yes stop_codon:yes gene_type:complete